MKKLPLFVLLTNLSLIMKFNQDPEKIVQKEVLNILHVYIPALLSSELIWNLFEDISALSTDLLSSSSDKKNSQI